MGLTKEMKEREESLGVKWKDEGNGYASLIGKNSHLSILLAYIALPEGHPDIDQTYDGLNPDVNGGLTFGDGNVFGWDYGHYINQGTPEGDIKSALKYFKEREENGSS